jgi:hypothetical protein
MKTVLGLATATFLFAFGSANATEISPGKMQSLIRLEMSQSLLETVQYRRCRYWRRECAHRWGWGGWRYRRCLIRHGC